MSNINSDFFQLGVAYQTDKVTTHGYHRIYPQYLEQFRNKQGAMIEIGIDRENSVKLWLNYFKFLKIYGIDINLAAEGDRYKIYKCDQSKLNELEAVVQQIPEKLSFINDDGSHIPEHQLLSFNTLFPIVAEGGFYIIEDIETSYWSRGECYGYKTNYGYKHPNSMIEIFKEAADIINREFIVDKTRLSNKIQHYDYIESITFARNCIIVKKNYNANRDYRFKQFI